MQIMEGTLEITEALNGYYLYGKAPMPQEEPMWVMLGVLGDGAGEGEEKPHFLAEGYDPNDDAEMYAEAYGFELVENHAGS